MFAAGRLLIWKCTPHLKSGLPGSKVLFLMFLAACGIRFILFQGLSDEHSMFALYHNVQISQIFKLLPRSQTCYAQS
jgi:hypothetical protein